ncbi:hypothetical protein [Streptomyces sp. PTY087I2]|uniref:hypothetical protein n=1 Tax=Streptomyces sp. PTY087I2 TaxID=1819298 RepID=UPI00159EDF6A|nr:hypothetical protein [Streptomyces sp. PTY087I2]
MREAPSSKTEPSRCGGHHGSIPAGSVTSSRTTNQLRDVVASRERKARASSSGLLPAVPGVWTSATAWA